MDSEVKDVTISRYKVNGVNRRQFHAFNKCMGLATGQVVNIDRDFRRKLCECSPKQLCFESLRTANDTIHGGTILYFTYDKR